MGVTGDPNNAVAVGYKAPEMSAQVTQLLGDVMANTKETMGASDTSLGNVRPENTSAIIAIQRATSMPLELQKLDFYRVVEEEVRIMLDIRAACYGVRVVEIESMVQDILGEERAEKQAVRLDFAGLQQLAMRLNIEIGGASYWSEMNEAATADAMFAKKVITDPVDYLEQVPDGYIRNKAGLIEKLKKRQAAEQAMQQAMQQSAAMNAMGGGGLNGTLPEMPV